MTQEVVSVARSGYRLREHFVIFSLAHKRKVVLVVVLARQPCLPFLTHGCHAIAMVHKVHGTSEVYYLRFLAGFRCFVKRQ